VEVVLTGILLGRIAPLNDFWHHALWKVSCRRLSSCMMSAYTPSALSRSASQNKDKAALLFHLCGRAPFRC
jgi:hypothetical protein